MTAADFPTKDRFVARMVTELDFDLRHDIRDLGLYVDLSGVRSNDFYDNILYQLSVDDGRLERLTDDYKKILFSGHIGCGKTIELRKMHRELDRPEGYMSILVELERETNLSLFQPEDFFVLLLLKLVEELKERGHEFSTSDLESLAEEWLSEEELKKEVEQHSQVGVDAEAGFSTPFLSLVTLKARMKSLLTASSKTTETIRTKVKRNPTELIDRFNRYLGELRLRLEEMGLGRDILFIVDGLEKVRSETYTELFIKDSMLLRRIECNMILAVSINAYYSIDRSPVQKFPHSFTIPMVKTEGQAAERLKDIVTKRLDAATFFEEGVLDEFVTHSGGCVRQLLTLVNTGLMKAKGGRIGMEHARSSIDDLGQRLYEQLAVRHIEILRKNDPDQWPSGDDSVKELLFNLALLKYNGHKGINPLLLSKLGL